MIERNASNANTDSGAQNSNKFGNTGAFVCELSGSRYVQTTNRGSIMSYYKASGNGIDFATAKDGKPACYIIDVKDDDIGVSTLGSKVVFVGTDDEKIWSTIDSLKASPGLSTRNAKASVDCKLLDNGLGRVLVYYQDRDAEVSEMARMLDEAESAFSRMIAETIEKPAKLLRQNGGCTMYTGGHL